MGTFNLGGIMLLVIEDAIGLTFTFLHITEGEMNSEGRWP